MWTAIGIFWAVGIATGIYDRLWDGKESTGEVRP
jgi:hypothetical protein